MWSEICPPQKANAICLHSYEISKAVKPTVTESRTMVAWKVLKVCCTIMKIYLILLNSRCKNGYSDDHYCYVFFTIVTKQHICLEGLYVYEFVLNISDITLTGSQTQPWEKLTSQRGLLSYKNRIVFECETWRAWCGHISDLKGVRWVEVYRENLQKK